MVFFKLMLPRVFSSGGVFFSQTSVSTQNGLQLEGFKRKLAKCPREQEKKMTIERYYLFEMDCNVRASRKNWKNVPGNKNNKQKHNTENEETLTHKNG